VTYACLSLAENLGAQRITVYGADFSYPSGRVYAKGTYIYPYFERRQERRSPLEALLSSFLYRTPFLPAEDESRNSREGVPIYETATLRLYRKRFEQKASLMDALVTAAPGLGVPFSINKKKSSPSSDIHGRIFSLFAPGKILMDSSQFLEKYRRDIAALPFFDGKDDVGSWLRNLDNGQRRIFTTLLPQAAALKYRRPELSTGELIEEVKRYSTEEIEKVMR
jgi:hypothetical protein